MINERLSQKFNPYSIFTAKTTVELVGYCVLRYQFLLDVQENLPETTQVFVCPNVYAEKLLSSVYSTWDITFLRKPIVGSIIFLFVTLGLDLGS